LACANATELAPRAPAFTQRLPRFVFISDKSNAFRVDHMNDISLFLLMTFRPNGMIDGLTITTSMPIASNIHTTSARHATASEGMAR